MSKPSLKPGWKMVKFGNVVKNANLVERDPEGAGIERIVGLEHLDPENLHIRRWNTPENGTSFTRKFVPGQTLFGKRRAYQRKVAYAKFEGICSGDILTFEPKDKKVLLPELLPFICQSDPFFDHALSTSAGSLSPRTSWKALKDFEFPLPPIDEQKRIAEILWAADEVVEKWLTTKISLQNFMAVFFRCLVSESNTVRRKIGDLGNVITGSTPSTKNPAYYDKSEYMFVSPADITSNKYVERTEKMVSAKGFDVGRAIPCDAVMVVCIGSTTGKVALSSKKCITNQQINSLVCGEIANPHFVYHLFKLMEKFFYSRASCTAVPILNKSQFSNIEVSLPSLDEQERIVEIMHICEKTEISIDKQIKRIRSMIRSIREGWAHHV